VVKAGGGLAALAALGIAGAGVGRAQEASPEASPAAGGGLEGRYVAIRNRAITAGAPPADEMISLIREGYAPIIQAIPGFVAYLGLIDPNSQASAFVTIFEDKAGTDEGTVQAGAWLQENGYEWFEGEPHVVEGPIGIAAGSFAGDDAMGMATPVADGLEGKYVAMRSRKLVDAAAADALIDMIQDGFVPLVSSVPGFVAYLVATNEETLDQVAVGVFEDKAGADESTARAAEWGTQGAIELTPGDPVVFEGELMLAVMA
jgi:hypothetical protein